MFGGNQRIPIRRARVLNHALRHMESRTLILAERAFMLGGGITTRVQYTIMAL
jgi:hypothetical protein